MLEPGADTVRRAVGQATSSATSRLTYVESRSALARMRAGRRLTAAEHRRARAELERRWPDAVALDVSARRVTRAAQLCDDHVLRAYDALHLSTALDADPDVTFATWDADLHRAASDEGMAVLPEAL